MLIGLLWLWFIVNSVGHFDALLLYVYWLVDLLLVLIRICCGLLFLGCSTWLTCLAGVSCVTGCSLVLLWVVVDDVWLAGLVGLSLLLCGFYGL